MKKLMFIILYFIVLPNCEAGRFIEFNTDMLDLKDRENIDLNQFSRGNFIMPGQYSMKVYLNNTDIMEYDITYLTKNDEKKDTFACIDNELIKQLGLKDSTLKNTRFLDSDKCLDITSIPGMKVEGDITTLKLNIFIPKSAIEYTSDFWEPPARWDDGVVGAILDYNINGVSQKQLSNDTNNKTLSGNGTTGINLKSWRFRADWQGRVDRYSEGSKNNELNFNRYYMYRAIPSIRSKLTIGESYLDSNVFDGFRFTGGYLSSDDNMLPPNLRGYAPEVSGIAKTNAKVTISQKGQILSTTQVAAGPFRIQDLNNSVTGELDVLIEEQDGTRQHFTFNTANIPYLTRPGTVRYKIAVGKPSNTYHDLYGPEFLFTEYSWGITNGWSLYGGVIYGEEYNSLSSGIGRDLMSFGALALDYTHAWSKLPDDVKLNGGAYRVSYSKKFDQFNSQITFAGYKFSERDFMSMNQYLDYRFYGGEYKNGKEMYTMTLNQQLSDINLNIYLDYAHTSYWDDASSDRYSATLASYVDIGSLKNINVSLSAYRNNDYRVVDDGAYLSLSIPWHNNSTLGGNFSSSKNDSSQRVSYFSRVNEHNNYQLNVGHSRRGKNISGYYNNEGDISKTSLNGSYQEGLYKAIGFSTQGGFTITKNGAALHRINITGGTRMLVDTSGISNVPVKGSGSTINTNYWGKAVITDLNDYYRNKASIDLDKMADNIDASNSIIQATLTEGAIGFRKFDVIAGEKRLAIIKLSDNRDVPFGSIVMNDKKQQTGIVGDQGIVYLTGINPSEVMFVNWNGETQCKVILPSHLPEAKTNNYLLLPCH